MVISFVNSSCKFLSYYLRKDTFNLFLVKKKNNEDRRPLPSEKKKWEAGGKGGGGCTQVK